MPGPESDLDLLTEAALEAGEIACRYWRQKPAVWEKDAGAGPVTEADLAVNDHLHARLTGARPGYGWLSEESPDNPARLDAAHCFIIDPIDGTRAFIDGQEGFSHSLAITRGDQVVAAVVHLPAMGLTYSARVGGPALLNGRPIHVSDADIGSADVLCAKNALDPVHWQGGTPPGLRRKFRPSLAWRLCLVAEGRFDAVLSLRMAWEWDIAAGCLIAQCAGASTSTMRGQRMRFNNPEPRLDGLLIANPRLHDAMLARLSPA
ncbi:MAG: 3'(2'),5'-bisphosphate nucleotidase CysQ [Paracoccus sp. (in: a-proteobacteria)]|nr:3'(2'),5'-bisphosphate nucleotidase CysQ [Paracoccus sp. (in: a-proteobacteria)]